MAKIRVQQYGSNKTFWIETDPVLATRAVLNKNIFFEDPNTGDHVLLQQQDVLNAGTVQALAGNNLVQADNPGSKIASTTATSSGGGRGGLGAGSGTTLTGDTTATITGPGTFTVTVTGIKGHVISAAPSANGQILIYNIAASGTWAPIALSGDVTMNNAGVTAIGANKVTNAQLAQMAANTFQSNLTGGTANAVANTLANVVAALLPTITGRLLRNPQVLTTGTTTYTTPANCTGIVVFCLGDGGGGGGASSAAVSAAVGGGGGAGAYTQRYYATAPATACTCAIGAGGAGGANTGVSGTAGTGTSFTLGGVTVAAVGGSGGVGQAAGTSNVLVLGGAGGTSTNGNVNSAAMNGGYAIRFSGTMAVSGAGGSTIFGGGGGSANNSIVPQNNGTGLGSGGSGACVVNGSAAAVGGNGAPGLIIIYEYC